MEENIFVNILRPAMMQDNSAEDDYKDEDGLLMCGKCHTRKQTFFEVEGLIPRTVVPCLCECEQKRVEEEKQARQREEARQRIEAMRRNGIADEQYISCTFALDDREDEKASDFCRKYVEEWKWAQETNAGLMLYGDVGGGKTFLAACIANALVDKGVPVMMTTIPRLVAAMQENYGDKRAEVLRKISTAPLLVLDDVGTERGTSTGMELAYEIINTRYKAQKPLIVTTNLTMQEIRDTQDIGHRRLYDRIVEMCAPLKVSGAGRRQKAARAKLDEMKARFGA